MKEKWQLGDRAELRVKMTERLVRDFADWSGDMNPLHLDADYAQTTRFHRRVVHGMSFASLFSRLIGMELPGAGALWTSQTFEFCKPVFVGDELTLSVEIIRISESSESLELSCLAKNQLSEEVMRGKGEVVCLRTEEKTGEEKPQTQEKVAIVTGASRGIGEAIARRLDALGFSLCITYKTSRTEVEKLAKELRNACVFHADLSDPASIFHLYDQMRSQFGPPTTLVLNAGDRDLYGSAAGEDFQQFARHLSVQLESSHVLVSAALPHMKNMGRGEIIAIGSTYALGAPPPTMAPYVVAKTALAGWIRCLAVDLGRFNIRSNIVAPGITETALLAAVPDRQKKVAAAQNPLRRIGQPDDVAGAVAYLVSEDGAYVNGETLVVNGGALMV